MDIQSYLLGKKSSGGGSDSSVVIFNLTSDEQGNMILNYTPKNIIDVLQANKLPVFRYFDESEGIFAEDYAFMSLGQNLNEYELEFGYMYMTSLTSSATFTYHYTATGLNGTFTYSKSG